MISVLVTQGFAPTGTASGEDACHLLAGGSPSIAVVVSDVNMPGMGGEDLNQELASRWPAIPVILMSGYPPRQEAGDGLGGASDQSVRARIRLQKPFSSHQIAVAMRTALCSG
jgi:DNA-binding NtrC family response regulator